MTTELVPAERPSHRALIVADALDQEAEQRRLLGRYVQQHMTEGTDYGVIPGTKNKTLLKPGAEKLTQLFRCTPRYTVEEKIEDWEKGLFYYRFSCRVENPDGVTVAEGVGSCSTYESRYRWRVQNRRCPVCQKECIRRSKFPPRDDPQAEPGWYCYGKDGGCGANFAADDPRVTDQQTGRVQNPDLIDSVNTVLKMAKKRALVDAAIALARCSDIFTQDTEDAPEPAPREQPARQVKAEPAEPDESEFDPATKLNDYNVLARQKGKRWADAVVWLNNRYGAVYPANMPFASVPEEQRRALVAELDGMPNVAKG